MKENTKKVFNYLKEHDGEQITATKISEDTGIEVKSVNGIVTSALVGVGDNKAVKGYAERIPGGTMTVKDKDGNDVVKPVKFIQLTEKGRESTVESIEAEEIARAQAKALAKAQAKDAE